MSKVFQFLVLLPLYCLAQHTTPSASVIPKPIELELLHGVFRVNASFLIVDEKGLFGKEINVFNKEVKELTGFSLTTSTIEKKANYIKLLLTNTNEKDESYHLLIKGKSILIEGSTSGVFYGLQSLFQLIAANYVASNSIITIPELEIRDSPRYTWRGMHLDVCRHFFTKDEVKKYIDYLALYKFNTFHWHLTEDQGWRIKIKKYPLLTSVGSHRKGTIVGSYSKDAPLDNVPHSGFYTQEDIKEIVAYANARHITVVPEIEMPGHALAALSAYSEFSCTGGPFEPATTWGVFDDVFCAGNDSTFMFLENIIAEVCDLFPSTYIHIGGDECPKTRWKDCAKCKLRMEHEQLKDEHELQSYFIQRIERFVNAKGKKIIGWDEILEGGLAPNAAVMSWQGTSGGITAAKQQHAVVMTPGQPCYFDHYQSLDKENEPLAIGGYNPLEAVYAYEPTPKELTIDEQKFILGAQGNVWTEYMPSFSQVEYMTLPRMCALSETLWTTPTHKNYTDFILRLKNHSRLLDSKKANYAKHFLKP